MRRHLSRRYLLPLVLGISDGILNALTLASSSVITGRGLSVTLAVRVGVVALVSAVFAVFVSTYAELRASLSRSERELNMTRSGRLAATNLGRQVAAEATVAAVIASVASFAGAFLPLMIGALIPRQGWLALVAAVLALAVLGVALAKVAGGRAWRWAMVMLLAGVLVAAIGAELKIT